VKAVRTIHIKLKVIKQAVLPHRHADTEKGCTKQQLPQQIYRAKIAHQIRSWMPVSIDLPNVTNNLLAAKAHTTLQILSPNFASVSLAKSKQRTKAFHRTEKLHALRLLNAKGMSL
jgi:hypothetical protein